MSQTQFASQVLGGLLNSLSSAKVQDLLEIEHNRTTHFNFALRERERERERESLQENKEREREATSQLKGQQPSIDGT
jgi:hypothetical protein